jgi:hypothetical protein
MTAPRSSGPWTEPTGGVRTPDGFERTLQQLMSLSDGDRGVLNMVAFGPQAVPLLREPLFQREPSGLFDPRRRVVEVLAALGADNVLAEFLRTDRDIADPVERAGEDAVLNAAARAVGDVADEETIRRLLWLAEKRHLAGPIEVLGLRRLPAAMPCLIAALEDDLARPAAADAIRRFGRGATCALARGASDRNVRYGSESESSLRRRRTALALLLEIGDLVKVTREQQSEWVNDADPDIAVLGCRVLLSSHDPLYRHDALQKLALLSSRVHWRLRLDIDGILREHGTD